MNLNVVLKVSFHITMLFMRFRFYRCLKETSNSQGSLFFGLL